MHTKGPWTAEFTNVYLVDEDRSKWELLADCRINDSIDYPKAKANARLIAAAPELLGIVENYADELHSQLQQAGDEAWKSIQAELERVEEAIRKAKEK